MEKYVLRVWVYSRVLKNDTATMFFLKKPSLVLTSIGLIKLQTTLTWLLVSRRRLLNLRFINSSLSVRVPVCVYVCLHDSSKYNEPINLKHERFVEYGNCSD